MRRLLCVGYAYCLGLILGVPAAALHSNPNRIEVGDKLSFTVPAGSSPENPGPIGNARLEISSVPVWLSPLPSSVTGPANLNPGETVHFRFDFLVTSTNTQQAELVLRLTSGNDASFDPLLEWHYYTENVFLTYTAECLNPEQSSFGGYISADTAAPITAPFYSGATYTDGSGNLYLATATGFGLDAVDQLIPDALSSGVAFTGYLVDAINPAFGQLLPYPGPFSLMDGTHSVVSASSDNANNAEALSTTTLRVDGTPPVTTFWVQGTSYAAGGVIYSAPSSTHSLSPADPVVQSVASGVAFSSYSVDGGAWVQSTGPILLVNGTHAVQFRSQDNVGNLEALNSQSVKVDAVAPGAIGDLRSLWPSTSDQATLNWTNPGNDGASGEIPYATFAIQKTSDILTVQWSTASAVLVSSLSVVAGSAQAQLSSGLLANTTYHFRVWTQDQSRNWSDPSNIFSTQTRRNNAPTGLIASGIGVTSAAWQWNGTGDWLLYYGTSPLILLSTSAGNSFFRGDLSTNTAYSIAVATNDPTGLNNLAFSALKYTLAADAAGLGVVSVSSRSASLSWQANTNPATTRHQVSYSTAPGFDWGSVSITTFPAGFSGTVSGLAAATTFYLRVQALNGDDVASGFSNVVSTRTLNAAPETPMGLAGAAQGSSSITWTWNAVAGVTYEVYPATGGPSISTPTPTFIQTALSPNVSYGTRVSARDSFFTESFISALVSTATLAAVPASLAATSATIDLVDLAWDVQGNSTNTIYELSLSTDAFASVHSTPIAFADQWTLSTATVSDLSAGATCWFRIRARNIGGTDTAFSIVASTQTLPDTPVRVIGVPLGVSSITFSWNPQAATGFKVFDADGGQLATVSTNSYTKTGLTLGAPFGINILAYNGAGNSELTGVTTGYSAVNPPGSGSLVVNSSAAITASWGSDSNPAGTQYILLYSSMSSLHPLSTSTTTATSLAASGLLAGTTYYFKVLGQNAANFPTDFTDLGAGYTFPAPPNFISSAYSGGPIGAISNPFPWARIQAISVGQPFSGEITCGTTGQMQLGTGAALSAGP